MLNSSGIGRYIKNTIGYLAAKKPFEITCLGHAKDIADITKFEGLRYINVKSRIFSIEEQVELPLKIPKCDLYWSPQFNVPILPIAAKKRIVTIPDVLYLAYPRTIPLLNRIYARFLINCALNHSDKVVAISKFTKSEILKYSNIDEKKVKVIYCSVDEEFNQGFNKRDLPDNYILYVGNVKPHKNLKNALLAYRKISSKNDVKFYIIGKREGFITGCTDLGDIINELKDKVVFTGFISDDILKNYYSNARLFILPSYYEGFGIPILEAMKFGLPIIASRAGSIPEVGGDAIDYFDPYDVTDIANKMKKALSDDHGFNKGAYTQQLLRFSWEQAADEYIALFKETIGEK